jgi:predicted CXXCH cytochrome family protein
MTPGRITWTVSLVLIIGISGVGLHLWRSDDRRIFLPGRTSDAHYQIEIACSACHAPFQGVRSEACLTCHGARLLDANDTHPVTKFDALPGTQTRNSLDATRCITCHREHVPHVTRSVAVTQPSDFCVHCHAGIVREQPSHRAFAFTTCASAGCHNYHDNVAMRADAIEAHRGEPPVLARAAVLVSEKDRPVKPKEGRKPKEGPAPTGVVQEWEASAHAPAGVNCPKCHEVRDQTSTEPRWIERPGPAACTGCHESEVEGFLGSRHGMRLAQKLSPMTPADARLPMKPEAHARAVTCGACHDTHVFDTRRAAVEGCLGCHDDGHSRAYLNSPHYALWRLEIAGKKPPGSGVSCATCHLPRTRDAKKQVIAHHNQNDNLRPVTRMLGTVCMRCHGLAFSIDALADRQLARTNYTGRPSRHVESIDMVETKVRGR